MSERDGLDSRLNQIRDRLLSEDFRRGRGLGNEIGFYIFDYPPQSELLVRERVEVLEKDIRRSRPDLPFCHINLFDLVLEHLEARKLLDKALEMQQRKGDEALHSALAAPLQAEKLAQVFEQAAQPQTQSFVLVSGVGSAYPLVRSHSLLNGLHAIMGETPLVMFYPGAYDGQSLRLFNLLQDEHYYRAFRLVA